MKSITQCPICHNTEFSEFISTQDFFLTNEVFTIEQCTICRFKFTNPRPALNELPRYYDSAEYISHSGNPRGIINKIYLYVRMFTLKSKARFIKSHVDHGQVLDIGCGTGEFLHTMQQYGFDPYGVEPNHSARDIAKKNYGYPVFEDLGISEFSESQFDVVTLWHVLEHVYDLDERISQIGQITKKDGILFVALPNASSWDANHYGKYWAAYDCPRHLYHFDKSTVKRLFGNHGFEIIRQKPMYFDSYYVSMLSEKYKKSRFQFLKGSTKGFLSNFQAFLNDGNYSSVIYVLKRIKT